MHRAATLCLLLVTASVDARMNGDVPSDAAISRAMQDVGLAAECSVTVDSFCHSQPPCNCSTFCEGKCAINATSAPVNMTFYRMTMQGVLGLAEKDSGDVPGDLGFVLSQRTSAYQCRKDPFDVMCLTLPHFSGEDPDNTDLVLEFQVEVDGQWGPYLYCNPKNNSEPLKEWDCLPMLDSLVPAGASEQCSAEFEAYPVGAWIWGKLKPPKTANDVDMAQCCDIALNSSSLFWSWHANNRSCVYDGYPTTSGGQQYIRTDDSVMALAKKYATQECNCSRAMKSVGIRTMTTGYSLVGGYWYSHPAAGECAPGTSVGTNGCTWRTLNISSAINASCMYEAVDAAVEALAPACFDQCAKPYNKTSTCYLECFTNASEAAAVDNREALLKPWNEAMNGGCPQVKLPTTTTAPGRH